MREYGVKKCHDTSWISDFQANRRLSRRFKHTRRGGGGMWALEAGQGGCVYEGIP
jgi:hypothetical protein